MNGLLNRVATVLDRRFMLVSFLPVLIFVTGLGLLILFAAGRGKSGIEAWGRLSGSLQIVIILSFLAAVWLLAGFVDSQLRNLTQLFEGYPLESAMPWLFYRARSWHVRRSYDLLQPPKTRSQGRWPKRPKRYQEEAYVLYPLRVKYVLPTRFGNVLRAAEEYSQEKYGANYLLVWQRLAHMCSERFVQDYEASRASVDFLLVVSTLSAFYAVLGGGALLILNGPVLLFVGVVVGGFGLSRFAYSSAVGAAIEYGEQIRASMDLFRLDLLRQLRYPEPRDVAEEQAIWEEFENMLRKDGPRVLPYEPLVPRPPDEPPLADPIVGPQS